MRHEIETWAESESPAARLAVQNVAMRITAEHAASMVEVNRDGPFLKVIVTGGGAVLRDVVAALTDAEYL